MIEEKSVPGPDQDTISMSVEATKYALKRAKINPKEIGAIYIGSESHPYAVKPSGTVWQKLYLLLPTFIVLITNLPVKPAQKLCLLL